MISSIRKLIALSAISAFLTGSAYADLIQGTVLFAGNATLDTATVNTATEVTNFSAVTTGSSGDFATYLTIPFQPVAFNTPWTFNSGPLASFWSVGGFTFDLISSAVSTQGNGSVFVTGLGSISGNGFTTTVGTWGFTAQDNPISGDVFSFSASTTAIPDSGSTAMMIGIGLIATCLAARRFKMSGSKL